MNILQFGGGNFLRGFVDWIIDVYNERTGADLSILVIKPTAGGDYAEWRAQDGRYHLLTKGIRDGELVDEVREISCVRRIIHPYREWAAYLASAEDPELRYVISNTTESGIRVSAEDAADDAPPSEFPAKLARWLFHRYRHFGGSAASGCILLPTELIEDNGDLLRAAVLANAANWELEPGFSEWIRTHNQFCNTLVDRIVPGIAPAEAAAAWERIGHEDPYATQAEPYHLWAIEAPAAVREALPLDQIGLNVVFTDDLTPYRTSKVRILNGAHTAMVPVAYLYGLESVREAVEHPVVGEFVRRVIYRDVIPAMDQPEEESGAFAAAVLDRFRNPFIHHRLISIALNSVSSKFRARLLPSLLDHQKKLGRLPDHLVFGLAGLLQFYRGSYAGKDIPLQDADWAIAFMDKAWTEYAAGSLSLAQFTRQILSWEAAWGQDLNTVPGLAEALTAHLAAIERYGVARALEELLIID